MDKPSKVVKNLSLCVYNNADGNANESLKHKRLFYGIETTYINAYLWYLRERSTVNLAAVDSTGCSCTANFPLDRIVLAISLSTRIQAVSADTSERILQR
ncbi:hypothetical protein PV326_013980 [Microctonus aethiopoides]|nr:hypothetical protein PV326_013980 [Microctonus aethiopoides]